MMGASAAPWPLGHRPSVANTIGSRVLQAPAAFHGVGMRAGAIFVPSNSWAGEIQQNCDGDHGFLVTSQA